MERRVAKSTTDGLLQSAVLSSFPLYQQHSKHTLETFYVRRCRRHNVPRRKGSENLKSAQSRTLQVYLSATFDKYDEVISTTSQHSTESDWFNIEQFSQPNRITTKSPVMSIVDYCSAVCINSYHVKLFDVQTNVPLRSFCGAFQSTELEWLNALNELPIYNDISAALAALKPGKPFYCFHSESMKNGANDRFHYDFNHINH